MLAEQRGYTDISDYLKGLMYPKKEEGAADLVLADGWRLIHGGDTCDKGGVIGGSIRVVRTLCRLKRKYPNRVVLLLGKTTS